MCEGGTLLSSVRSATAFFESFSSASSLATASLNPGPCKTHDRAWRNAGDLQAVWCVQNDALLDYA